MRCCLFLLWLVAACSPYRHLPVDQPPASLSVETYVCENGQHIQAVYDNSDTISRAYVRVVGKTAFTLMEITQAASGARYANDHLVWWTKGDEGFLEVATPDWDGKMLIRECRSTSSTKPLE